MKIILTFGIVCGLIGISLLALEEYEVSAADSMTFVAVYNVCTCVIASYFVFNEKPSIYLIPSLCLLIPGIFLLNGASFSANLFMGDKVWIQFLSFGAGLSLTIKQVAVQYLAGLHIVSNQVLSAAKIMIAGIFVLCAFCLYWLLLFLFTGDLRNSQVLLDFKAVSSAEWILIVILGPMFAVIAMLSINSAALIGAALFTILDQLTIVVSALLELAIYGKAESWLSYLAMAMVIIGCVIPTVAKKPKEQREETRCEHRNESEDLSALDRYFQCDTTLLLTN